MVRSLKVPYNASSLGGFNIEDMILVTETGCESFNTLLPQTDLSCGMKIPDGIRGGRR